MSKYMNTKKGSLEESILGLWEKAAKKVDETNKNDKSDDGEGLDAVQPKAVKKKFKDRKDKDIDNDGDTDDSDKFLHKKRKAISKAIKKEARELGTKEDRDYKLGITPGQSKEDFDKQVNAMQVKNNSMRKTLAHIWGVDEGKNPLDKEEEKTPKKENKKTMTGKPETKVEVDPNVKETKEIELLKKQTKLKGKSLQAACPSSEPAA